ncbi:MAG: MFS transporter, partial [Acidimicrobiales bacterium]
MSEQARWWRQSKWRAFLALGSTYLIIVLATSFSFLALPSISEDFGVTLRAVGWVVITESLLIAALLLPLGGVADAVGRKRVLTAGMVVFGFGTLFTGLAPTFALVIAARVVMA